MIKRYMLQYLRVKCFVVFNLLSDDLTKKCMYTIDNINKF